jgi:phospholipid/cholesterol/gamma-HCH transport system substrate-binding protein
MTRTDTRVNIIGFLAATVLILGALVVFARYPAIFRTGREYKAVFKSVAGLNPGDEVRYGGLLVGTVTSMELPPEDPTRIQVRFRVRRSTPMRSDVIASISQVGLLGQPYLSLKPGSASALAIAEGSTLHSEDSPTFQDAIGRIASFLDRADTLLTGAERVARSSPLERLDRTLARIDSLTIIATTGTSRVFGQLDRSFAQLDVATGRLGQVLDRSDRLLVVLDTTVRGAGPGLASTQQEALQTIRDLRLLVGDLRNAVEQEGGLDRIVRNMTIASDNLARLTERLDRDPSSILQKRGTPVKLAGPAVR